MRSVVALPGGFASLEVIERTAHVEVHRADDALVAVSPLVDRDSDVRFRDEVRALDEALGGCIKGVWIEGRRAIAWPRRRVVSVMPREPLDALAVLEPAARTIARAHALGIGHGALAPHRIVEAGVLDLCVAAKMGLPRTPEYSAPEQLDASPFDVARADVYALALLFIAFVSGKSPWDDGRDLYVRAHDRLKRPSLGSAAARSIDRVLERALAVDAELRFANAEQFWDALRTAVLAAPSLKPEPPLPREKEPDIVVTTLTTRPLRAPASIIVGACVVLIAAGFGIEAAMRARPRAVAPVAAPVASSVPPTPSVAPSPEPPQPEPPKEMVSVGAFLIDRTEVTVRAFRACVATGQCKETYKRGSGWSEDDPVRSQWVCNFHRHDREEHPINCVSFHQATNYCAFVGKRLPTGDEWTKAARGDTDRKYPWGDSNPRCKEVVFARYGPDNPGCNKQPIGTQPADAHPMNASPYGALDMGGSLWEWTTETSARGLPILRGGAWDSSEPGVTIDSRLEQSPGNGDITLGFRCAK